MGTSGQVMMKNETTLFNRIMLVNSRSEKLIIKEYLYAVIYYVCSKNKVLTDF